MLRAYLFPFAALDAVGGFSVVDGVNVVVVVVCVPVVEDFLAFRQAKRSGMEIFFGQPSVQ